MANKDPSKTEHATGKRISETRSEGNVLFSMDVLSFAMILGGTLLLFITVPMMNATFKDSLDRVLSVDCRVNWDNESIIYGSLFAIQETAIVLAPICLGLCVCAIITMRAQVGSYFSTQALEWKISTLNPVSGFKSLMPSKHNFIKFLLTLGKVSVVSFFVYIAIKKDLDDILRLPFLPLYEAALWTVQHSYILVFKILIFFAIIAVIDYYVRHKKYYDDLMMTKQEVKDEQKNAEGDPRIKAKIRQKMRQLVRMRMSSAIPRADVVITNPTHVAVALKYEMDSPAPIVIAKGLRKRAELIKRIAALNKIPIVEAPPLARSLYRNSRLGGYIDPEFYGAVAAILAKLHRTGKRVFSKKSS
jgi:flagellar biosynthetic protein FlhB